MSHFHANTVASVSDPSLLVVYVAKEQSGWCTQFAEEGYDVCQIAAGQSTDDSLKTILKAVIGRSGGANWGLITYGATEETLHSILTILPLPSLKAVVHFCPAINKSEGLFVKYADNTYIPTLMHLSSGQEDLHASAIVVSSTIEPTASPSLLLPLQVHVYPKVPSSPPFPYAMKPPALITAHENSEADIYVRSAVCLSYSRTLDLLRRQLGPRFDLEKLWERHTYYEFVARDALKTMSTMVAVPYVNHVPTLTGGVGFDQLARFYKYHFTKENVTPPDTELITVSRTVGADRIIDEMIFKCTHTTEIDYFLPGVKPTGRPLELTIVGIVAFRGDKLTFDYWDQASALVQLGLLEPGNLPIAGVEVARKVVNPFGIPSNELMERWKESEGLSISN
ncbi:NTF2-like protein [Irpex rosettiformis]|uniref:NTF2-like protein n=1 Tax=Irpex rosettiformis TaxID=378272 RepID=A0ACB8UKT6_9APHY|nr:NTF2-like protein [Irpex rosettiformis]